VKVQGSRFKVQGLPALQRRINLTASGIFDRRVQKSEGRSQKPDDRGQGSGVPG